MVRWWWPQSRTRLSSEVGPPSAQWWMWWAWHMTGGRVQPGNAQWVSRTMRAVQIAGVTSRRVRPTSRTQPSASRLDPHQVAVARHAAYGGGSKVEAVLGDAVSRAACSGVEVVVVDRDADAGSGAVAVGDGVGVEGVLGEGEECVPEPGAVISRVGLFLTRLGIDRGNRGGGGGGGGEGEEGGAEGGAVLGRAGAA